MLVWRTDIFLVQASLPSHGESPQAVSLQAPALVSFVSSSVLSFSAVCSESTTVSFGEGIRKH